MPGFNSQTIIRGLRPDLPEDPTAPLELTCFYCWDFMTGNATRQENYLDCKCGHEAGFHGAGHTHPCCFSTVDRTGNRQFCGCMAYHPNFETTRDEVFASLSKIIEATV